MIADLKPYTEYNDSGLPWLGGIRGLHLVPSCLIRNATAA